MEGGNGVSVSERNYAFADRRTKIRDNNGWFASGELRNSAPVSRFVTAFQSTRLSIKKLSFLFRKRAFIFLSDFVSDAVFI